jgi:sulfopyruvate decarboxylase subunit alpha
MHASFRPAKAFSLTRLPTIPHIGAQQSSTRPNMINASAEMAKLIADELASCGVELVASLPDGWIAELIRIIDADKRFTHIPVNREESAIGLCSGAYMGAKGSVALMGASGLMTVIYAITKINYTYEIPLFLMTTLRGAVGDNDKFHVSNGLYLLGVLDAIAMPYTIIDRPEEIEKISQSYRHWRRYARPAVVALTRNVLRGQVHP